MIFLGEASLRHAVKEYMAHYHTERNHQGMGNHLLKPITVAPPLCRDTVHRRERLGGMLIITTARQRETWRCNFWTIRPRV